jgi:hypothetical protein
MGPQIRSPVARSPCQLSRDLQTTLGDKAFAFRPASPAKCLLKEQL